ncbi:DUF6292 family protein [Streptomyces sp. NPDC019990]|uniref:DUF6292 family protein n=1 Tax=Streptomyces sp. NPDC019990 TaxID=3154693 RepID=UPI0033DAD84B
MPVEATLQESHRAYIRAVAAALTQAGIGISDVDFLEDVWDDGDPIRCAHIHLTRLSTMQVYGVREVWISWTEEWGWTMQIAAPGTTFEVAYPLWAQVLPAPADVLAAVQAVLAELPEDFDRPRPAYRSNSDWDEALETQLDVYTEAEQHVSASSTDDSRETPFSLDTQPAVSGQGTEDDPGMSAGSAGNR